MHQPNRPFRAEIQKKQAQHGSASEAAPVYDDTAAQKRHAEVMAALKVIHEQVKLSGAGGDDAARALADYKREVDAKLVDEYKREVQEAATLKHELQELSDAIHNTKKEIAKLHPMDRSSDRIAAMTDELDAIVTATEGATESILSASEVIEGLTERLRMHASSEDDHATVEDITEQIMKIFEACNFQDLTGQRITRVVNTLRFIEERVESMISALGGEEKLAEVSVEIEHDTSDNRLLHGPTDGEHRISQDEIDNLFD